MSFARPTSFFAPDLDECEAVRAGFRFGDRGAHTSRTMMLAELDALFAAVPATGSKDDYRVALLEGNVTGKQTASNRSSTLRSLSEFYVLDPSQKLFRVLSVDFRRELTQDFH